MAKYLETAAQLKTEVDAYLLRFPGDAVALGHIINLAVRCNPRPSQGTVRKNIVAKAVESHCIVTMTKETSGDYEFNKIHIKLK